MRLRRPKRLCPACMTPQREHKDGKLRIHKREISKLIHGKGIRNREEPPSLRGPGGLDDWSVPPGWVRVYAKVWCEGSGSE